MGHGGNAEILVEPEIGEQVQAAVKEREETNQTAILDEPEYSAPPAQRSDSQTDEQQNESSQPGAMSNPLNRIRAKGSRESS